MNNELIELINLKGKDTWVVGGAGYLGQGICKMLLSGNW